MGKIKRDITGQRFGRLTAVSYEQRGRITHWNCVCDCGGTKTALLGNLLALRTKSCGCLIKELPRINRETAKKKSTYRGGISDTPEYRSYMGMINRCTNTEDSFYKDYGGRGISIFPEWLGPDGFDKFFKHVGQRPSAKHTIDRFPNNNGNYEPGNVRWATKKEQARNRRSSRIIEFNGERKTLAEWAEEKQLPITTLCNRFKLKWDITRIMTTPCKHIARRIRVAS